MLLYDYFRSSAAYRVRIALNLKGLAPERAFVHLRRGAQRDDAYLGVNPHGLIPALVLDDGTVLTQSMAIIEYLDETHPSPPLLPREPVARARVRALALAVVADTHPLGNLRVLQHLQGAAGFDMERRDAWYAHWIDVGLTGLEADLARDAARGRFCHGDTPTLADCCVVPQLANARRAKLDVARWPVLAAIDAACNELPAFAAAAPARQPDAE
ncbi:MAG: maleylacetoacetate isomerase [Proteobacteria bacterium]|nr:maleylacetoacetate isomerase [Pseudomonadota bacterium]